MAWLLDTNVISELRKTESGRGDANVAAWQSSVAKTNFYISAITIMELEIGILSMERKDAAQGAALRRWMTGIVMPEFARRTLPFDARTAIRCASLHVTDLPSWRDSQIAATALVNSMTIVTRNVRDFDGRGVAVFNPWTYGHGA